MLTSEIYALLSAIRLQPDDDAIRLALADELDGQDTVSVPCPCLASGYAYGDTCGNRCLRTGFVLDTSNRDRAELLRVQCELVRRNENWPGVRDEVRHWALVGQITKDAAAVFLAVADTQPDPLQARESALLAAHPDWLPPCPHCDGGNRIKPDSKEYIGNICGKCGSRNGGRIGQFRRGLLEVQVPMLATVFEREKLDPRLGLGPRLDQYKTPYGDWQLTTWAQQLRTGFPWVVLVEVGDKKPFRYIDQPSKFGWSRDRPTYRDAQENVLPPFIWDLLSESVEDANVYDSLELAHRALGLAVARALFSDQFAQKEVKSGSPA